MIKAEPGYLEKVRKLCNDKGILLIFDEIQTGLGRTGYLFAHQSEGVTPDVMTLAKGLANGLPMGAVLATEKAASAFTPGSHATTFGATPLVSAAAVVVIEELTREGFMEQVRETGDYFMNRLIELAGKHALRQGRAGPGADAGPDPGPPWRAPGGSTAGQGLYRQLHSGDDSAFRAAARHLQGPGGRSDQRP